MCSFTCWHPSPPLEQNWKYTFPCLHKDTRHHWYHYRKETFEHGPVPGETHHTIGRWKQRWGRCLQARGHPRLPARQGQETGDQCSLAALEGTSPGHIFSSALQPPNCETVLACVSHLGWGFCYTHPRELYKRVVLREELPMCKQE